MQTRAENDMATVVMQRLPFRIPDFNRCSWVSDAARQVWEPRIKRISHAWQRVEMQSVIAGVRRAALISVWPDQRTELEAELARMGFVAEELSRSRAEKIYSNSLKVPQAGELYTLRLAIGKADAVRRLSRAYLIKDAVAIGSEFGYPECCAAFFDRYWNREQLKDTTWPMAVRTTSASVSTASRVECQGSEYANILWRWSGVRAVPHLPCSFDCADTVQLGQKMIGIGRDLGLCSEMDDLLAILSWPVYWSALHGIAEIKTPIFKQVVNTDATPFKYSVLRRGTEYPSEGPAGTGFPFAQFEIGKNSTPGALTKISSAERPPAHTFQRNGFKSVMAMDKAHQTLVSASRQILGSAGGNVIDMGCGDGTLLHKIAALADNLVPYGVDLDSKVVAAARTQMPPFADNIRVRNLWDVANTFDLHFKLVLMAVCRFDEVTLERANEMLHFLTGSAESVLFYHYADGSQRPTMEERLARIGIMNEAPCGADANVSWSCWNASTPRTNARMTSG
jgi:SAM-dependent methyltransferase